MIHESRTKSAESLLKKSLHYSMGKNVKDLIDSNIREYEYSRFRT